MFIELFQNLGLAKNEARVYETLLEHGENSVGRIATISKVNRRNVYDTLNRLVEKGLVFEILGRHENRYQAVDPKKLSEVLEEKQELLRQSMPEIESVYHGTPHNNEVYIYKGIEGWKNYLQDILRIVPDGGTFHCIGSKGAWQSPKLGSAIEYFEKEIKRRGIKYKVLYDHKVKNTKHQGFLDSEYKFLPEKYSTSSSLVIFGDHVGTFDNLGLGDFGEETSFSMIVNQKIADDYRTWFQFMWDSIK